MAEKPPGKKWKFHGIAELEDQEKLWELPGTCQICKRDPKDHDLLKSLTVHSTLLLTEQRFVSKELTEGKLFSDFITEIIF